MIKPHECMYNNNNNVYNKHGLNPATIWFTTITVQWWWDLYQSQIWLFIIYGTTGLLDKSFVVKLYKCISVAKKKDKKKVPK